MLLRLRTALLFRESVQSTDNGQASGGTVETPIPLPGVVARTCWLCRAADRDRFLGVGSGPAAGNGAAMGSATAGLAGWQHRGGRSAGLRQRRTACSKCTRDRVLSRFSAGNLPLDGAAL